MKRIPLLSLIFVLLTAGQLLAAAAYNRTTNTTYATLKLALQALNGKTLSVDQLIEWEGDQVCSGANVSTLNSNGFKVIIRPVGYVVGALNNPRPTLDAGGTDNAMSFNNSANNNLGNIEIYGGYVVNFNYNSGACKAISGIGVKGNCLIKDVVFQRGAIPIRWVGYQSGQTYVPCGNITIEDCVAEHGYGAFRMGLGLTTTERDLGDVIIRRCRTRWNRRYQDGTLTDPGNAPSGHIVFALKNFNSLLIEDCDFDGAGKSMVAIENTATVTIRRCKFRSGGLLSTAGACIDYKKNGGYAPVVSVTSCLFTGNFVGIINSTEGGELDFRNNTIEEPAGANKNIMFFTQGAALTRHYNNIYNLNSTATAVVINFGSATTGVAANWLSDANSYYKTSTTRSLIGGSIGGTPVAATNLSNLQQQSQNDPGSPFRDSHSIAGQAVFRK